MMLLWKLLISSKCMLANIPGMAGVTSFFKCFLFYLHRTMYYIEVYKN